MADNQDNSGWVNAGLSILGGGLAFGQARKNRKAQAEQNSLDRQFQRDMYEWSRWDAKSDWEKQNFYNSPAQQMQRYKEAGLNPNLIYGQTHDAGPIRGGTASGGNQPAPQMPTDIGTMALGMFTSLQTLNANVDNLRQSIELSKQEQRLKGLQADTSEFELGKSVELRDTSIQHAKLVNKNLEAQTEKIDTDIDVTINHDQREELALTYDIQLTVAKIIGEQERAKHQMLENAKNPLEVAKLKAEIRLLEQSRRNAQQEGIVKEIDARLLNMGYDRRDPVYFRLLMDALKGNIYK